MNSVYSFREWMLGYAFSELEDWMKAEMVVSDAMLTFDLRAGELGRGGKIFPILKERTREGCGQVLKGSPGEPNPWRGRLGESLHRVWDVYLQRRLRMCMAGERDSNSLYMGELDIVFDKCYQDKPGEGEVAELLRTIDEKHKGKLSLVACLIEHTIIAVGTKQLFASILVQEVDPFYDDGVDHGKRKSSVAKEGNTFLLYSLIGGGMMIVALVAVLMFIGGGEVKEDSLSVIDEQSVPSALIREQMEEEEVTVGSVAMFGNRPIGNGGLVRRFLGIVDEVKIWNRTIRDGELVEGFNRFGKL